ncbi:DNA repair helicase RAD3 [Rhizoctonia solani AG-3 Rhs1AP]|uniref:DNA 5'-3' helicase n=2 Tax=Rhizoctonia solani AG-3 TaxID=1086053 RepID=A0A074RUG8_9AGAM|nr:DNA repair helicase RAD3 [Rhizoctonia solani AG-3 Rhs1AP]KEP48253.1 DNA repair helicase RAD3 [Rhizoctonia solani 123E]
MKFFIDDLPIIFPYDRIYPEQYSYMCDLKRTLDATGHCVLEMPSGTGKTVSLLSLIVSYQQFYPTKRKLIYCSRTVPEIEKALSELKRLMAYRISQAETPEQRVKEEAYTGLGLTSRKNLCLHPEVSKEKKGKVVDARCRDLTSSQAVEKGRNDPGNYPLCAWHEGLNDMEEGALIPAGIHTLADLSNMGRERTTCPYFTIRRMMPFVDVIIYSFHYLLDPKVAEQVSKEFSKDSIVVFDEAHNIDNVCIESLSIDLTRPMLEAAARSVTRLGEKIDEIKATDATRLQDEYEKLVEGLQEMENDRAEDAVMANPVLPDDLLTEAVPGNIRKAEHFIAFLKRLVEYLKTRMRVLHVVAETPLSFLQHLKDITYIERRPLRFCAERLQSLIRTLELTKIDEYSALQKVANFATLVSTYEKGFLLILEPFEGENTTVPNPIFHFTCLDPSLAIKPVFERFSSVVITSGTISPLDMYPKMLQFTPVVQETYPMTLTRNCFLPLVITRGSDQVAVSSRFEVRNDPSVVRNFGSILIEYCKIVPDGVVAFFPSYLYMESIVAAWHDMGILSEVWKNKLIFVETPDANETSVALENYRKACDNGRGAVLLSVARGKVSEGIDFDHNYGRAVIMFGIPYQYTESRILKARLEYLRDAYRIRESEFLGFDAMRNAAQCVGRVLRGKTDWGLMIFADKRFARADKRSKLPRWINQYITESASNLSTDMALVQSKLFMRTISQSHDTEQTGVSLWTKEDVEAHQAKLRAMGPADVEMNEDKDGEEDEYDDGIPDDILANVDLDDV